MAIYNEIQVGRYARLLQKLFGLKGEVPTKQLSGEIIPVHPLFAGSEQRILETWRLWSQSQSIPASVGNLSGARFRNPAGSNVVAVFEKILLHTSSAATGAVVEFQTGVNTDLATPRTPQPRDFRLSGSSTVVCTDGNPAAVTAGDNQILFGVLATNVMWEGLYPDQEIILTPGSILEFWVLNANTILNYNAWWRERPLEETERSPLV